MDAGAIIALVVVAIIIVGVLAWIIGTYNKMVKTKIKVGESESGIDVALTKRFDVLTKQLEIVKGYAKHEKETLVDVVAMRGGMTMKEKSEANHQYEEVAKSLNIMVERYPDLKANTNFQQLQVTVYDVEEHLQAARRLYNANVSVFNQMIIVFPSSIIAKIFKFVKFDFFEADDAKKNDVKMDFNM